MVLGMHPASLYLRRNRSAPMGMSGSSRTPRNNNYRMCTRMPDMHFVYMVRCADGTLYTGYTRDPEHREKVHNSGRGAKYTANRLPVSLVSLEECGSLSAALRREYQVKGLSRGQKELLLVRLKPDTTTRSGGARARQPLRQAPPAQSASTDAFRTRRATTSRGRQIVHTR